jgi:DNA polymerase alpha subunit B
LICIDYFGIDSYLQAQYLEQRLENFEMTIAQQAGLAKLQPLASASQMVSVYCGRICCDTEEGKINLQSITLEGSLATSKGARVKVDISACTSFRLFPGQIVAIIGTNPSGFCIVAKEILCSFAPDDEQNANMESVDMVVACGPFTTAENLYYEPLQELLEYCIRTKPDCLLLLGPFVDAEHPEIKQGMAEVGYDDLFHDLILAKLAGFHDSHGVKIILMPSIRDVQHEMVIPQIPIEVPDGMVVESIQNPCTFRYKGSVFGCSSVDWLMSSTREEISKSADPVDRLPTLSLHLLNQKR